MPALPSHISPTLQAIHARRTQSAWQGRGSTFIPASEAATECARAVWYSFRWASQPEGNGARSIRRMDTGVREEQRILDDLASIDGVQVWRADPQTGKQWRAEIAGYIAVKPDAVVIGLPEAPKSPHVVECKATNEKNFRAIKTKGLPKAKPDHWLQVQLQMLGMSIKRALYYVVNTNDDDEHILRIKPDAEYVEVADVEATERAVARLVNIAEAPRPPGRIHDDPHAKTSFNCRFCRHFGVCADGATARVSCRTCLSATPRPGGVWWCEHHERELTPEEQGAGCEDHLYLPDLVPGDQIDASAEQRTVTYRMRSGETWIDGNQPKILAVSA